MSAPGKKHMSKAVFHTHVFEYDPRKGALVPHKQANAANCPAGRVLTETGKQLRPGITPGITVLMTSVFDEVSMIRGFIHAGLKDIFQPYDPRGLEEIKRSIESKKREDEALIELEKKKAELAAIELAIQKRATEDLLLEEMREKKRAEELRLAEIEAVRRREEEARINKAREAAETRKTAEVEAIVARKIHEEEIMRKHAEAARIKAEEEAARIKAEEEAARIKAEEEAARIKAEEEAARKKAEEEAARIKAEEEAAVRKMAEEEAAARKKAEEEVIARKKAEEAEEEAAARKKAEEAEEEAAARKKAEEETAARRKEEEQKAYIARKQLEVESARRKAEQEENEHRFPILSMRVDLPSYVLTKYIEKHSQLVSSYQDVLIGKQTENVVKVKVKDGKAICSPYAFEDTILNIIHYSNFKISGSAPGESKIVQFVITNFSGGAINVLFDKDEMVIENESCIDIPGKQERTCIISCYSDGEKMIEYARSMPLLTPKNTKF